MTLNCNWSRRNHWNRNNTINAYVVGCITKLVRSSASVETALAGINRYKPRAIGGCTNWIEECWRECYKLNWGTICISKITSSSSTKKKKKLESRWNTKASCFCGDEKRKMASLPRLSQGKYRKMKKCTSCKVHWYLFFSEKKIKVNSVLNWGKWIEENVREMSVRTSREWLVISKSRAYHFVFRITHIFTCQIIPVLNIKYENYQL